MLSKMSQREKDKYCMVSLICGISKQNKMRQDIKLIDTENILMVARGGGGKGWEK